MAKNADFGQNLAVFGPKTLIFMGVSKSFGTNITEIHFGNLFASFFGQALDQVGQKCRYLAQTLVYTRIGIPMRHLFRVENIDRWGSNWSLGAKMCFFDPKIWIFGAKSQFFV